MFDTFSPVNEDKLTFSVAEIENGYLVSLTDPDTYATDTVIYIATLTELGAKLAALDAAFAANEKENAVRAKVAAAANDNSDVTN